MKNIPLYYDFAHVTRIDEEGNRTKVILGSHYHNVKICEFWISTPKDFKTFKDVITSRLGHDFGITVKHWLLRCK